MIHRFVFLLTPPPTHTHTHTELKKKSGVLDSVPIPDIDETQEKQERPHSDSYSFNCPNYSPTTRERMKPTNPAAERLM